MKAYYIFNDLNIGPDNIRVQGQKKRFAYDKVEVRLLVFPDRSVLMVEIGQKFLSVFQEGEALGEILKAKGANFEIIHCDRSTDDPEKEKVFLDGTYLNWRFDNGEVLSLLPRQSQNINYYNWFFGPSRIKHNVYGGFPLTDSLKATKMYEGDEVPSRAVMKKVAIDKPTPNWVIAIIVFLVFFIAAIIYSVNY